MEKIELHAKTRQAFGKKTKLLRKKGRTPGVVYGHKIDNISVDFNSKELTKILDKAGTSTLVQLKIDDSKSINILLQESQLHPISGEVTHIDCYAVRMDEKIETEIPLEFIGVSPAVDELEGNLVISKEEVTVRCLPAQLISKIEVDISVLKTFDDSIRISDLNIPSVIEVLHEQEEVVVSVSEPISEEELAELETDTAETEAAAVEELGKETDEPKSDEEPKS